MSETLQLTEATRGLFKLDINFLPQNIEIFAEMMAVSSWKNYGGGESIYLVITTTNNGTLSLVISPDSVISISANSPNSKFVIVRDSKILRIVEQLAEFKDDTL